MSLYEFLLFVHLLGAATWFGGGVFLQLMSERSIRAWDHDQITQTTETADWLGNRLFGTAAGLVVVSGVWMVIDSGWNFSDVFVIAGIAGFALSTILGIAFFGPETARVKELMAARGLEDAEVKQRLTRIVRTSRYDTLVIGLVIAFMTIKPWN